MTWQERLQQVLDSWRGTKYANGQGLKGVRADCVGFVGGVLDELHGYDVENLPPLERHAPDLAWHDPVEAARISVRISRRWPHCVLHPNLWFPQPGDVPLLAVNAERIGGHVAIMGARPNEVWHCADGSGVCFTGIGAVRQSILRVWRPLEKESWSR
jgi:cell wall-associated NlpC family hydrolase